MKITVIIGHSLGGVFTLRILEKLDHPIKAAFFVGAPIGVRQSLIMIEITALVVLSLVGML